MPICLACKRLLMKTHDWDWAKTKECYPICKDCYEQIIMVKKPVVLPLSHRNINRKEE